MTSVDVLHWLCVCMYVYDITNENVMFYFILPHPVNNNNLTIDRSWQTNGTVEERISLVINVDDSTAGSISKQLPNPNLCTGIVTVVIQFTDTCPVLQRKVTQLAFLHTHIHIYINRVGQKTGFTTSHQILIVLLKRFQRQQ